MGQHRQDATATPRQPGAERSARPGAPSPDRQQPEPLSHTDQHAAAEPPAPAIPGQGPATGSPLPGHALPEPGHALPEQAPVTDPAAGVPAIPEPGHVTGVVIAGHAIPEQAHAGEAVTPAAGSEPGQQLTATGPGLAVGDGGTPEEVRRSGVPAGGPTPHRAKRTPVDLPALPVRARLAVSAGQVTVGACRALRRGWSSRAGGQVALRLDPRLAGRLAAGRTITLVSGTNGKSTTTRMVTQALRGLGPVAATRTSAGSEQAVVSALTRDRGAGRAVLEVDELALPALARTLRPAVIVLLNVSREYQPERGLAKVLAGWRELFDTLDWPCTVLANVDDPLIAWAAANAPRLVGVAGGLLWPQDALLCPDCGVRLRWSGPHWWCQLCGVRRPQPAWQVTDDDLIVGPEVTTPLRVAIAGRAAPADALFAVAAAHTVGSPVRDAGRAVARVSEVDGRYAAYPFEEHTVHLHLADNPAAWREIIDIAGQSDTPVVFAMEPDGVADATVLWDAPGELLHGVAVTVAGARRYDIAAWLEVCGVEVAGVADDPLAVVSELPPGEVLVAGNHPAFTALRARLRGRT